MAMMGIQRQADAFALRIGAYTPGYIKPDVHLHPDELAQYANPMNPPIDRDKVKRLTPDLAQNGVQRPVAVISDGRHALMDDGHHRTQAAQAAGLSQVPTEIFRVHPGFFNEDDHPIPLGPGLKAWFAARGGQQ